MKTLINLIITLLLFSQVLLANENIITSADAIEGSTTATLNLICTTGSGIAKDDRISFTVENSLNPTPSDLKTVIATDSNCPFKPSLDWTTVGTYSIFVTRNDDKGVPQTGMQTPKQIVANAIGASALTKITAINPKIGTPIAITLTLTAKTIIFGDKIIFAIPEANGSPSSDKKEFSIKDNNSFESGAVTTDDITFTKDGTYKIWIERKGQQKEQTSVNLVVAGLTTNDKANMITRSTPVYFDATTPSSLTLEVTDAVAKDDIIFFLEAETFDSPGAKSLTVPTPAQKMITGAVLFPSAGLYNIFYQIQAETSIQTKQTIKQVVYAKRIDETLISAVAGTDVKANKAAMIKFTYPKNTLYNGDRIIFSLSTGTDISSTATDNLNVDLFSVDFSKAEHTQLVTFKKEGTYSVWIKRGTDALVKQTGASVKIIVAMAEDTTDNGENSSNWIDTSFILLLGLLLL